MNRRRSALLWGLIGALSFLVLHQGYLLIGGRFVGFGPVVLVTLVVGTGAAIGSYYLEGALAARAEEQ